MWFDDQFENTFRRLSNRFFANDDFFEFPSGSHIKTMGPYYYGYQMTIGPDGKPHVKEWGNVRPSAALSDSGTREPYVEEALNEKDRILKLVSEMPGIEKSDINVSVADNIVTISAERGERKYNVQVPLKYEVDENSAKATYKNGILELTFNLAEEKPKGTKVSVE